MQGAGTYCGGLPHSLFSDDIVILTIDVGLVRTVCSFVRVTGEACSVAGSHVRTAGTATRERTEPGMDRHLCEERHRHLEDRRNGRPIENVSLVDL